MQSNYVNSLELVLKHEGGYVNHPDDPGGITNLGITKRTYEGWVGHEVDASTMQDLVRQDVEPIYKVNYWDRVKGDELPSGLDLAVFDFAVNAGTGRAAKYLQRMVGATQDGAIGPMTLKAVQQYVSQHGVAQAVRVYGELRQQYYEKLKHFDTFGRGWTRRVEETTEAAIGMAGNQRETTTMYLLNIVEDKGVQTVEFDNIMVAIEVSKRTPSYTTIVDAAGKLVYENGLRRRIQKGWNEIQAAKSQQGYAC